MSAALDDTSPYKRYLQIWRNNEKQIENKLKQMIYQNLTSQVIWKDYASHAWGIWLGSSQMAAISIHQVKTKQIF